ncbi:hypothetical protein [Sphingomonas sp.]|uniref:hypothetical protein n=1 Tax=Sphingomonas sp. TaxID=28214 RepID=UPI002ED95B5B
MILTAKMRRQRLPLWLALVVALLSALMFGGMPRTTVVGSAFNPATTAVALQPSRARPYERVEAIRRDDEPPGGQGDAIAVAPLPVAFAPPRSSLPPPSTPLIAAPALSSAPVLDGSPRGPPLP